MTRSIFLILCGLLQLAISPTQATPLQLLLDQFHSASPGLQAEVARVESLREQASASSAFPAPELSLEWGNRAVSPGMSNQTMYYGGVIVGQEFMFPGKRASMQKAEAQRTNMAQADYQVLERNGAFRIAQLYLEIHMTQQRKQVLDLTLAVLVSIQESARRRFETGMAGMEDVFRLQAEMARLRSDSLSLMGDERAMRIMLSAGMGITTPANIPTVIAFSDKSHPLPELDSLLSLSHQRPELSSMSSGKHMATNEFNASKLRKIPDLMLQGKYMTMMGPDEWSLMVGVKVPIAPWSSAQYRSEEGAAKAREKEAMAREQNMALMIEQDVRESVMRLQTAQDKLRQVLQEQVVTAQNALRSAQISYGSGKSDLTMSLDAVRMVLMAKEEAVMAHTGVLLATLNLEKATGVPPGTWLLESTSPQGVPQ